MNSLELKVPPPLVALATAAGMWAISRVTFVVQVDSVVRIAVAVILAFLGGAISTAGIVAFRRARTTLNPTRPDAASSLVTGGIYRVTRNPMYVGLLLVLLAWAAFLGAPWTLAGPVVFVAYMDVFQIGPEERALEAAFGETYAQYVSRVRRWM